RPTVVESSDERCEIRIPLSWRTRNHLGSMYFGALFIGADTAAALMAMKAVGGRAKRFSILFKDAQAEFFKRAEADVHVTCEQSRETANLTRKAAASGERESLPIHVVATFPKVFGSEPVASFTLMLSVKRKE